VGAFVADKPSWRKHKGFAISIRWRPRGKIGASGSENDLKEQRQRMPRGDAKE
jgi:hypothetical protein